MNKYIICVFLGIITVLTGCQVDKKPDTLTFAVSADYPPFEYTRNNTLTGFDIELGQLIAKKLGKVAVFEDMQFSSIFASLKNGMVDATISTITITQERQKEFDFSDAYYIESMDMVSNQAQPLTLPTQLSGKKIACQLGTTMEFWLKKHALKTEIISMDNNNQAIEALKAGHVDGVLTDTIQSIAFCSQNPQLTHAFIANSDCGYGIAIKKGSPLKSQINTALQELKADGSLEKLQQKWLKDLSWKN